MGWATIATGLLTLLVATSACHRSPKRTGGDARVGIGIATRLEIANPSLQGDITLVKADGHPVNGILEAQVELQSQAAKARNFEYTFRWFDARGAEVRDPKAHWLPAQILAGDTFLTPAQKAPNADVAEFRMQVRALAPATH
jgi:uncharacterized protein YcfL